MIDGEDGDEGQGVFEQKTVMTLENSGERRRGSVIGCGNGQETRDRSLP